MVTPTPVQDRSRARREALLRAAISLLAEGGSRAVTHRAVAARAGVPAAATTYYFASIQQLMHDALMLHVTERVSELRGFMERSIGGGGSIDEVAARFIGLLNQRELSGTIAQFEVFLEAARNPALRAAVAETMTAFEQLMRDILVLLGARHPERGAAGFIALINGFAITRVARPDVDDTAELLDALRSLFIVQLMTDRQLAQYNEQLNLPAQAVSALQGETGYAVEEGQG